jgi:hypothetical protein
MIMKKRLPSPTTSKTRQQMADEYNIEIKAFRGKLKQAGIHLSRGQIIPADQMRIYRALGPPTYVWIDGQRILFKSE